MEQDTFRNRLTQLTQKTRKALRLYSSSSTASKTNSGKAPVTPHAFKSVAIASSHASSQLAAPSQATGDRLSARQQDSVDYSSLQVEQWRDVTKDLLQKITPLLTVSSSRKLVIEFYGVRDQFYNEWRLLQADLHTRQLELESAAENGEFIKCVDLSVELVALKARMQACQAAHNELQRIIENSKVATPSRKEIESTRQSNEQEESLEESYPEYDPDDSNVIPLRRRNY